ncbi:unnamed protein product [Lampetra planeri]
MAQADIFRGTLGCLVCLELLKDPVTVPCGHSFCMRCLQQHWDNQTIYSCPQCEKTFTPRPELGKNTVLAELVEELKHSGLQDAPADHCYAGAEDVACDSCASRKRKALKSCLVCLASFCHKHLQPHYDAAAFKRHKLVDPSHQLQENICSRHSEVMKMFCRTDQQCICSLCPLDEHKGHDTVSAAAERADRQKELETRDKLLDVLRDTSNISQDPVSEPRTRAELLQFSRELTLDPNTMNTWMLLSEGNRKVTGMDEEQSYPRHSDRFTYWPQVLSSESLTGRCYWEVELTGNVGVAVAYKTIIREGEGDECVFGWNAQSWTLYCHSSGCRFWYNKVSSDISGDRPSRVGVFLDHRAGVLSFYSVRGTKRLLHRVQTTFTQPLYTGIRLWSGSVAELLKMNK